ENGLYYYDAQACMGLAVSNHATSREASMVENLRRALDLAARYDYEYWLRQEISVYPTLFASEDAQDLLPVDLRGPITSETVSVVIKQPDAAIAPAPLVDLTINVLGSVE